MTREQLIEKITDWEMTGKHKHSVFVASHLDKPMIEETLKDNYTLKFDYWSVFVTVHVTKNPLPVETEGGIKPNR